MKVHCQYSGIDFEVSYFSNLKLTYAHPIFTAAPKLLLSRVGDWAAGKLNESERRLLFLALLNTTELIEWRSVALPSDSIVQNNMEPLAKFVGWMIGITNPTVIFSRIAITSENRYCENAKYWIEAWIQEKRNFDEGYRDSSLASKQMRREEALERLIKNHSLKTEDYARLLAIWTWEACNVPTALREIYTDIFTTKNIKIYEIKTVDLEDMLSYMEDNLDAGSIFAHASFKHVRLLLAKNRAGLAYGLGMQDGEFDNLSFSILRDTPFIIQEDPLGEHNMEQIAITAPAEEPVQEKYPSKLAFLRAKSAWQLMQSQRNKSAAFEEKIAESLKQDEADNENANDNLENSL